MSEATLRTRRVSDDIFVQVVADTGKVLKEVKIVVPTARKSPGVPNTQSMLKARKTLQLWCQKHKIFLK